MKHLPLLFVALFAISGVSALAYASGTTPLSTWYYRSASWITTNVKTALNDGPRVQASEIDVAILKSTAGVTSGRNDLRVR